MAATDYQPATSCCKGWVSWASDPDPVAGSVSAVAGGWLFTALVTAGPAFWLFPPPFVHNIILPMLNVIGAV